MTTLTALDGPPQHFWHVPLAQARHHVQDAAATRNAELPSAHDTTILTEPQGRAA